MLVAYQAGVESFMKRIVLLSVVVLLLALGPLPIRAAGEGAIQGQVRNDTPGGGSTAGLEVALRVFRGAEEQESLSTLTGDQGQFRFEGLETGSDWAYLARVTYAEVIYSSGLMSFQEGEDELSADVMVYETTTDDSDIVVERAHIFVTVSDAGMSVSELYVFNNPTDRTYIGKEAGGLRMTAEFMLPSASHSLALEDGSMGRRFLAVEGGFADTEPQWPGSTQALFSYEVDCPAGECDLSREIGHPISNLNLLINESGGAVSSSVLVFQGKQDAQGQSFLNYVGRGLTPGQRLDLQVRMSGATAAAAVTPAPQTVGTQALPWILLGTLVTALVLAYPFWRRRIEAAARADK